MPSQELISLPRLAALTSYSRAAVYWRAERGYIETVRDEKGFRKAPVSEVARLIRRDKFSHVER